MAEATDGEAGALVVVELDLELVTHAVLDKGNDVATSWRGVRRGGGIDGGVTTAS